MKSSSITWEFARKISALSMETGFSFKKEP
jgi:hypothetical protein